MPRKYTRLPPEVAHANRSEAMKAVHERKRKLIGKTFRKNQIVAATAEVLAELPLDTPPDIRKVAEATGVTEREAVSNIQAVALNCGVDFARARNRILANLEEVDREAKIDRDHSSRVRANLGTAKVLGLDRPPLLTPEEQRAGWADFLATINAVVERHLAGEALDAFRDDLRATLAPMMGPQAT